MVVVDKRRYGVMPSNLKAFDTLKEKCQYLEASCEKKQIKVSFAVFNQDCLCVKIHKCIPLMELLKYISWAGFRTSVDQILMKIKYAIDSGSCKVYDICLARDFNLNILILEDIATTQESVEEVAQ